MQKQHFTHETGKKFYKMWTNDKILRIALEQSARDLSCEAADFLRDTHVFVKSKASPDARKYLVLPFSCQMVSYGSNIVVSASEELKKIAANYLKNTDTAHAFETPSIHLLNRALEPFGQGICFMAEYFLPDLNKLKILPCAYEARLLDPADFKELYKPEWSNALCADRSHLDVLGVGAYDGEKLIGLAACSADCETMWQIGVDVLPEYRRQGIASALTSRLANEILDRGKIPFYCAAWCNIKSVRNAIKSGFIPAWVEMTAKPLDFIDKMIKN